MLLRSKLLLGLFGLALAVSATTVFAVSFSDEANAKRFGFSSSKKENSSSETGSAEKSKHGDDSGEGASEGSGFSFKPRKPSGEDDEGEKDAAQSSPPEENVTADKQNNQSGSSAVAANESVAKTKAKPKAQRAPNPLAAAHPGMDVVVCEAGCANESEVQEAVYMQPTSVKVAELKPSSTAPVNGANEGEILCLGGCYDTPKAYRSAVPGANVAGQWMTSVVPTSAKPSSGSGEWMRRIDEGRKSPQPAVNVPTPSNVAPPAKAETN
ncbi:MAG: hypothetical protein ACK5KM_04895 [Hyphomicrobiaceae bacterium]